MTAYLSIFAEYCHHFVICRAFMNCQKSKKQIDLSVILIQNFPPQMESKVTVIRHPRENLKKCSLRHLHTHPNFEFFTAVDGFSFDATGYTVLEIDAPGMSPEDIGRPLLLLDSTWHLLPKIRAKIYGNFVSRSLPASIISAYPRISKMHSDPSGLATVEALYAALRAMGDIDCQIIKDYPFALSFLKLNSWTSDIPSPDFFSKTLQIEGGKKPE